MSHHFDTGLFNAGVPADDMARFAKVIGDFAEKMSRYAKPYGAAEQAGVIPVPRPPKK